MTKKGVAIREKIRICKFQGGEKVAITNVGTPPPPSKEFQPNSTAQKGEYQRVQDW